MMTPELAKLIAGELKDKPVAGWKIGKYLGCGGSAAVFRADKDGQTAAVKVYSKELVQKDLKGNRERLDRQLQLRDHNHPHLVKILDGGECRATQYLYVAMEYLEGQDLQELLLDIPRDKIRQIIKQVAQAAFYLHERGLVHRDIKPSNIAISPVSFDAKLLDLGVIKPNSGDSVTDNSSGRRFLATKRYAPPELIARVEKHTPEAWEAISFYQLGGVLHDLIARRPLFDGIDKADHELEQAVLFRTPSIVADDVPGDLIQLARDCLQKDPVLRHRFVRWNRFLRPETRGAAEDLSEVLARIAAQRAPVADVGPSPELLKQHEMESAKTSARQAIDTAMRAVCIGRANTFPPVTLRSAPDSSESDSSTYSASFRYMLEGGPVWITLFLITRILDAGQMAVTLELSAGVSLEQLDFPVTDPALTRELFAGTFSQAAIHDALAVAVPRAVDKGLQVAQEATIESKQILYVNLDERDESP